MKPRTWRARSAPSGRSRARSDRNAALLWPGEDRSQIQGVDDQRRIIRIERASETQVLAEFVHSLIITRIDRIHACDAMRTGGVNQVPHQERCQALTGHSSLTATAHSQLAPSELAL